MHSLLPSSWLVSFLFCHLFQRFLIEIGRAEQESGVGDMNGAGNVARIVRHKERDQVGNILRLAHSLHEHFRLGLFDYLVKGCITEAHCPAHMGHNRSGAVVGEGEREVLILEQNDTHTCTLLT